MIITIGDIRKIQKDADAYDFDEPFGIILTDNSEYLRAATVDLQEDDEDGGFFLIDITQVNKTTGRSDKKQFIIGLDES